MTSPAPRLIFIGTPGRLRNPELSLLTAEERKERKKKMNRERSRKRYNPSKAKENYQKHREEILAWHKDNYRKRREEIISKTSGYYQKNRVEILAKKKVERDAIKKDLAKLGLVIKAGKVLIDPLAVRFGCITIPPPGEGSTGAECVGSALSPSI